MLWQISFDVDRANSSNPLAYVFGTCEDEVRKQYSVSPHHIISLVDDPRFFGKAFAGEVFDNKKNITTINRKSPQDCRRVCSIVTSNP